MNNFTPRAQQVLAHARREADRFNHHYIGTEHLLLGLLKLGKGVAVTILENLGVELSAVRKQVEEQIGRGTEPQAEGNIPYTPRVRKVLAMANREAQELNHTYVGTEHLLLGLIRDGDGVAGQILRHFGVDLEQARRELRGVTYIYGNTPFRCYEFNRFVGAHDNVVTRILSAPGMWMQNFTTNEPDDSMIEVAIEAMKLVIPAEKGKDQW